VDWFPDFHSHNYRTISDWVSIAAAPLGIVRDESGDIRWIPIISTIITAAIVGGTATLISVKAEVQQIQTKFEVWTASRETVPQDIARLIALNETLLSRITRLEQSEAPATAKRFTSDNAKELEERLTRRIERLEGKRDK
jgi:hypothetical protein